MIFSRNWKYLEVTGKVPGGKWGHSDVIGQVAVVTGGASGQLERHL